MEIDEIRKLIELMEEKGVSELELKHRAGEVRLVRGSPASVSATVQPQPASAPVPPPAETTTAAQEQGPVAVNMWVLAGTESEWWHKIKDKYEAENPDVVERLEATFERFRREGRSAPVPAGQVVGQLIDKCAVVGFVPTAIEPISMEVTREVVMPARRQDRHSVRHGCDCPGPRGTFANFRAFGHA